jgi:hypothetical protein
MGIAINKISRHEANKGILATETTVLTMNSDTSAQSETPANAFRGSISQSHCLSTRQSSKAYLNLR